jgi:hypothetical protein
VTGSWLAESFAILAVLSEEKSASHLSSNSGMKKCTFSFLTLNTFSQAKKRAKPGSLARSISADYCGLDFG